MAKCCCHGIMLWMLHAFLNAASAILSLILIFSSLKRFHATQASEYTLSILEELLISHVAFAGLCLITTVRLLGAVSSGDYLDELSYNKVDKDFGIVTAVNIIFNVVYCILGIVIYAYKNNVPIGEMSVPEIDAALILALLIVDLFALVFSVCCVVVAYQCTARERLGSLEDRLGDGFEEESFDCGPDGILSRKCSAV